MDHRNCSPKNHGAWGGMGAGPPPQRIPLPWRTLLFAGHREILESWESWEIVTLRVGSRMEMFLPLRKALLPFPPHAEAVGDLPTDPTPLHEPWAPPASGAREMPISMPNIPSQTFQLKEWEPCRASAKPGIPSTFLGETGKEGRDGAGTGGCPPHTSGHLQS